MAIARLLDVDRAKCRVERFPDTEINVQLDDPVRLRRVFIIQSSCLPVDERAMEAFAIADACRRAAASAITWIAPYFGYARSDKRKSRRLPLMGRLIADFAERVGINQLIAFEGGAWTVPDSLPSRLYLRYVAATHASHRRN
jgi:ribose-phosphate pyrophosphokinase